MRSDRVAQQAAEAARWRAQVRPGRVDVFQVIRTLGIQLLLAPLPPRSLEGAFLRRRGREYVLVNTSSWVTRQRWTAAHELGHYFLTDQDGLHADATLDRADDRKANLFAGHFLMDGLTIQGIAAEEGDSVRSVLRTAKEFEVSLDGAAYHLSDLGLISSQTVKLALADRDGNGPTIRDRYQAVGLAAPPNRRPTLARDAGPEYLEAIRGLAGSGLLTKERADEMVTPFVGEIGG
jgi:Zn-dependent peptidase ImmA (M78 family)